MRKFLVPALLALLVIPATAQARTLWLKQARAVSARIAAHDSYINRDAPDWAGAATTPVCVRKSRTRATCDYTINYTRVDGKGPSYRRYCKRRVSVALRHDRPVGHLLVNLDCALQDHSGDPDYEA